MRLLRWRLPAELFFTPAELEHLRREAAAADERRRQQRAKEQAQAEEQARRARESLKFRFAGL